ncbi:hypothetical protein V8C35DRAFT_209582 [Trichoderma chlorosporum]
MLGCGIIEDAVPGQEVPAARAAQQPLNEFEDGGRGYSFEGGRRRGGDDDETNRRDQWSKPADQPDEGWQRSAQPADSGLSPLLGFLLVMATWEAGAPLRCARERTRRERVRFGAD